MSQTQAFRGPRSQDAPQRHLTLPGHWSRSAPSSGAVAPGFPKVRARGAGLRPRSASGVCPASDFDGTFPRLFVHRREGPRPGVCPGEGLGASSCPGPRPCVRPRFSPSSGPRVGPGVARGGGLGPGGDAGLGPALSAGPGVPEPPTYLPWPVSVSPPRSDPRATIHHQFHWQVAKHRGGGRGGGGKGSGSGAGRSPARTRTSRAAGSEGAHLSARAGRGRGCAWRACRRARSVCEAEGGGKGWLAALRPVQRIPLRLPRLVFPGASFPGPRKVGGIGKRALDFLSPLGAHSRRVPKLAHVSCPSSHPAVSPCTCSLSLPPSPAILKTVVQGA